MIRQSLINDGVSALHHHAIQSSGDTDGDMSKPMSRRTPAPIASRIVVKKNQSLLTTNDDTRIKSSSSSDSPTPMVDPRSRAELLERNLRYVQQQHEITLIDLHNEISRLQEENRDLHFRMINLQSPSTEYNRNQSIVVPSIHQLNDLSRSEPIIESTVIESDEKRLQEVQRLHFEHQIKELQTKLIETEEKNEYLMRKIDELNRKSMNETQQVSASAIPVLLPDPNLPTDSYDTTPRDDDENQINPIEEGQTDGADYQNLLKVSQEKQRQQSHHISRLRAVLNEILHAERLSSTSKMLARDCLASINSSENSISIPLTPVDASYHNINQQKQPQQQNQQHQSYHRSIASSSTAGRAISQRHELPLRRLNLSPSQFIAPRTTGPNRSSEQRLILPPIIQGRNTSPLHDPAGSSGLLNSSLSPTNAGSQQHLLKFSETTVARRERRTQELQRTRLKRNLYH